MTTNDYQSLREVNDRQHHAIEALLTGATHAEAAEQAGVHRVTVSNWVKKHPGFQAELNRRRRELGEQRATRLRECDAAALDAVAKRLDEGDAEFAMKWLKLRGLNATTLPDTGLTDPNDIIEYLVTTRAYAKQNAELDELFGSMNGVDRHRIRAELEDELQAEFSDGDT